MSLEEIILFFKQPVIYIVIIIFVLVLSIFIIWRSIKKKNAFNKLKEYDILYNECISIPISFKLNKAINIARTSESKTQAVEEIKIEYEDLDRRHDEISTVLEDVEDALDLGKLSLSNRLLEDLGVLVEEASQITTSLDVRLDQILEEEQEKREEINVLKDRFRDLKTELMGNVGAYRDAYEQLELHTKSIETQFSQFEEWMFASDYEKANEMIDIIQEDLHNYQDNLEKVPKLYEMARGEIPNLLDHVSDLYHSVKGEGVHLEHLDVPKNIGVLAEVLKNDLKKVSNLEIESAEESLVNTKERLLHLISQMEKEKEAHYELDKLKDVAFPVLDEVLENISDLKEKAPIMEERFHFDNLVSSTINLEERSHELDDLREKLNVEIENNKTPSTVLLVSMNEIHHDIDVLASELYEIMSEVNQANADEIRAREQLMKLYLIINDVEVRIKKRSLPSISEKYTLDLQKSRAYVRQIQDLLDQPHLDIVSLNGTVSEAIDYIYKLHNNVNNLVGVVDMCENSIVYANKYRAFVPSIDSELTKAELAFNNGEYTQSLTMIINAIDKFKPNTHYEEMIKSNAQSAR